MRDGRWAIRNDSETTTTSTHYHHPVNLSRWGTTSGAQLSDTDKDRAGRRRTTLCGTAELNLMSCPDPPVSGPEPEMAL